MTSPLSAASDDPPDLFARRELEAVFQASTVGIVVTDPAGRILQVNRTYAAMLGWSPDEMVGRAFTEWSHPAESDTQQDLRRALVRGDSSGYRIEKRYLHRDGHEVWGQLSTSAIRGPDGTLEAIVGMVVDVSERRRLEMEQGRRLRQQLAVWTGSPVGLVWLDDAAGVVAMNPMAREMLGMAQDPTGASLPGLLGMTQPEKFGELWEAFLVRGTFDQEFTYRGPSGPRHLVVSGRARLDAGRHLLTIADTTALREVEAQLIEAQRMESIGRFAGSVAHDMNNVLTAISGFVELALPRVEPAERTDLEEALRAAQRAREMIRQLLAFSRHEVFRPEAIDLRAALTALVPVLRRLIGETVDVTLAAEEPLWSVVDPTQLEQIVMNLAVNARDAMPGGGSLEIGIEALDVAAGEATRGIGPGSWSVLTVADTGSGMDAATLARVFEPFFTTKANGKGTGLGLSTVYGIVRASGGQIAASSEPGNGTRFVIALPRLAGERPAARGEQLVLPRMGRARPLRILMVEDEDQVRDLIERILRGAGDQVIVAHDAAEAVRLGRDPSGDFDLIVTDVVMPGLSGHEVVRLIRAAHPNLPALFVSGYDPEAIGAGRRLPPRTAFLAKPFSMADLRTAVDQLVANRRGTRRS